VDSVVRILHAGSGCRLGQFRCRPRHPLWREENWIGPDWHLVIPGPAVWIKPDHDEPLLATANEVLRYPPDTYYWRRIAAPSGDRCLFLTFGDELAGELGVPAAVSTRLRHSALDARTYAAAHQLARDLEGGAVGDLPADERVLGLLHRLAGRRPIRPSSDLRRRELVERVKYELARRIAEPVRLAEIAAAVNYSPYHLARLFRAHTGQPMYGYLQQLRLRESLDQAVTGQGTLAELASEYGFANHSHYTRMFRQVFGVPPTALRGQRHPEPSLPQPPAVLDTM
jgi:AraC-like DNA-binding protein